MDIFQEDGEALRAVEIQEIGSFETVGMTPLQEEVGVKIGVQETVSKGEPRPKVEIDQDRLSRATLGIREEHAITQRERT